MPALRHRHHLPLRVALLALALAAATSVASAGGIADAQAQAPPCNPAPLTRSLANGLPTEDGAVTVTVDGGGSFNQAVFNPPGPLAAADTTNSSLVWIASPPFLEGTPVCVESEVPGRSVTTLFSTAPGLTVKLTQTLSDIAGRTSTLTQTYAITNEDGPSNFLVMRHLDGDLARDGTKLDGATASPGGAELTQFASGDAAPHETALAITGSAAGNANPTGWTIQPAFYRPAIEFPGGIPAQDNGQVNPGQDATMTQQWALEGVELNETVVFTTVTRFGSPPAQHTLSVSKTGDGSVTSAPPGINCGATCSASFDEGTPVALVPAPDPGWTFAGWEGACSGSGACVVTMSGARSVIAHFNPPPPVPSQSANATPVSGVVFVREPGTGRFVPLTAPDQLSIGSQIDTTNGRVQLTSARAGGVLETSQFYEGLFTLLQDGVAALPEIRLDGGDFSCLEGSFAWQATKKPIRRVWGSGKGKYRTRGRYSSATVRGTEWRTEDRCDGTLTTVVEGTVTVRDFVRQADVTLRAGQSYLAEPLARGVSSAGCTLIGTPGKDTLRGTPKADVLCGLGGNDVLLGMGGADRLYGGAGNDWLDGGRGNDLLNGGDGRDRLDGNVGRDHLIGGPGRDFMISRDGLRGNDRVTGGAGIDRCRTDLVRICP